MSAMSSPPPADSRSLIEIAFAQMEMLEQQLAEAREALDEAREALREYGHYMFGSSPNERQ